MPLQIIRNDITKIKADALVNTANVSVGVGPGVDESIYTAAGFDMLLRERAKFGRIEPGECVPTSGFNLDCRYILHTVGTKWRGGAQGEEQILRKCYRNSLFTALRLKCRSIAVPLMATGSFRFPKEMAIQIAKEEIAGFLKTHDILVLLVVYDKECTRITQSLFKDIESYIENRYIEKETGLKDITATMQTPLTLEMLLEKKAESFSETVLKIMSEKEFKPADVYTAANLDRRTFSKLKKNADFHPNKLTAVSIAIGLKLNVMETQALLFTAGYTLSTSDKFDLIIMYCMEKKIYNYMDINFILDDYGFEGIGQRLKFDEK